MILFRTRNDYIRGFQAVFNQKMMQTEEGTVYVNNLIHQLDYLIENITKENFWELLPQILGIDAKLMLLNDLMKFDDYPIEEIIRITENDYPYYLKEFCGYDLNTEAKHSLVFNIV